MRRNRITLVAVLIFVAAALIASCAQPYHAENERYVFVATNITLPYWQEAQAGFTDAAKALGVKSELVGPATYDPDGEVTIFPPDRGTASRWNLPFGRAPREFPGRH